VHQNIKCSKPAIMQRNRMLKNQQCKLYSKHQPCDHPHITDQSEVYNIYSYPSDYVFAPPPILSCWRDKCNSTVQSTYCTLTFWYSFFEIHPWALMLPRWETLNTFGRIKCNTQLTNHESLIGSRAC
jgi:hypothetical protein